MTGTAVSLRWIACLIGALLALGGCAKDEPTFVLVQVRGMSARPLYQMDVDATVGGQRRMIKVPSAPRLISLPSSFSLQIDATFDGTLALRIVARDQQGQPAAEGMGAWTNVAVGGGNQVIVDLSPVRASAGDAGVSPDVRADAEVTISDAIAGMDGVAADARATDASLQDVRSPDVGVPDAAAPDAAAVDAAMVDAPVSGQDAAVLDAAVH